MCSWAFTAASTRKQRGGNFRAISRRSLPQAAASARARAASRSPTTVARREPGTRLAIRRRQKRNYDRHSAIRRYDGRRGRAGAASPGVCGLSEWNLMDGEGAQGVRARGGPLASTPFGSRASAAERPRDGFSDVARGALGGADPKRGVAFEHVCRVLDDGGVRSEARGRPSSRARRRPGEARIDSRGARGGRRLRSRGDCDRAVPLG